MSDLEISKKTVHDVFVEKMNFLIPDYQRPYSWERDQRETLWEDLKSFAFPAGGEEFDDDNDEYFLGTIVTFTHGKNTKEVIDGQQRLITLMLLLRAFYEAFRDKNNPVAQEIAKCIWHTKNYLPDKTHSKIKSEVATDEYIPEFEQIIADGKIPRASKSLYAQNYRYFQRKIKEFKDSAAEDFQDFPKRIMDNCIILPIVAGTQDIALRIFTTLNDRGMQLSDSDIFKAQFYKFYRSKSEAAKENFVQRWKKLEELCNKNFGSLSGSKVNDLFMRYMYYLLAESETKSDTFLGLRPYYEKNNYSVLKSEETFENLETLAKFWDDVARRDEQKFSNRVLKRLYVLDNSPYSLWGNVVSLYFMCNRDSQNLLDDEKFYRFLHKITAMFLLQAIVQPGVQAIRRPFFLEFQNIRHGRPLKFEDFKRDKRTIRTSFSNIKFSNQKSITRAMMMWWMFQFDEQELPPSGTPMEIEHIYAKKRAEDEPLEDAESLELLGNKALLEKSVNVRAAGKHFVDKKFYYLDRQHGTKNFELRRLAETHADFTEYDILERNEEIIESFLRYLDENNLLR